MIGTELLTPDVFGMLSRCVETGVELVITDSDGPIDKLNSRSKLGPDWSALIALTEGFFGLNALSIPR